MHQTNWKPSRTARKKAEHKAKLQRRTHERDEKAKAKKRDRHACRFPGCGCKKLGLRLEVSHDYHKGMGGNPAGDRSVEEWLVTLCVHRHQDGAVSRHKGTLRAVYLTENGYNGPVAWEVDADVLGDAGLGIDELLAYEVELGGRAWFRVATEGPDRQPLPLSGPQKLALALLAEMDL